MYVMRDVCTYAEAKLGGGRETREITRPKHIIDV